MIRKKFYQNSKMADYLQITKDRLPENYSVSETGELYYNDVQIANFVPILLKRAEVVSVHTGESEMMVILCGVVNGTLCQEKVVSISNLKMVDFQLDVDPRCYVDGLSVSSKRYILNLLNVLLAKAEVIKVYSANRLGFFRIDGHRGYITGDRCITRAPINVLISENLQDYRLLPKKKYDGKSVQTYLNDLIALNKRIVPVLLAGDVLAITASLFQEAGQPVRFSLYARGEQSSGKTTMVTHVCSMFRRDVDVEANLHNLTASEAKLHKVLECEADSVIIIDDLRMSDSNSNIKHQEKVLDSLIRVSANRVGKETFYQKLDVRGFCVFIGEYSLKAPSTNNRIVLLDFHKEDLDIDKLMKVTNEPERLSFFFYWFIEWVLENYDKLVTKINLRFEDYYGLRRLEKPHQERLQSHGETLCIAYEMFLCFCAEMGWNINVCAQDFKTIIDNVLYNQVDSLELEQKEKPNHIVKLYEAVYLECQSDERCYKRPKKNSWNQSLYINEREDVICIPGETVAKLIERVGIEASVYDVMDDFLVAGFLCTEKSEKASRTKKIDKKRCYVIKLSAWKSYVEKHVLNTLEKLETE